MLLFAVTGQDNYGPGQDAAVVINSQQYWETFRQQAPGQQAPGQQYAAPPVANQQHQQYDYAANEHPHNGQSADQWPITADQQQLMSDYAAPALAQDIHAAHQQQGDAEPPSGHAQSDREGNVYITPIRARI